MPQGFPIIRYHLNHIRASICTYPFPAARLPVQHDECNVTCILGGYIEERWAQYWSRFPNGTHVAQALDRPENDLRSAGDCDNTIDVVKQLLENTRASLANVTHPAKRAVFDALAAIELQCAR